MNNAEKYPNTKDALEAYRTWLKEAAIGSGIPFDFWLECEYVEPREQTLLEVAEAALKVWRPKGCDINSESVRRCMGCLSAAVEREKKKPVRNLDVYATAKEADEAYYLMCHRHNCYSCEHGHRIGNINCAIAWLYAEADAAGKEAK